MHASSGQSSPGETSDDELVVIGRIVRTHGVRGEVRVAPESGDPTIFDELETVYVGERPYPIVSARAHKRQTLLLLEGVNGMDEARGLQGSEVSAWRSQFPPIEEDDAWYWHDLMGSEVVDADGTVLGTVDGVLETAAHDNIVLRRPDGREALIPFVEAMVLTVDVEGRRIEVDVPEGLIED